MAKQIRINDVEIKYEVFYRDIRCPRLEFRTDKLQVILPKDYVDPEDLIGRHRNWIYKTATVIHKVLNGSSKRNLNMQRTDEEFRELISLYVDAFSERLLVYPNKIAFRKMKSRWGSCSVYKKSISLNTYLRYLPERIIGYVIFHELTHLLERRHNKRFWQTISRIYPDYKEIKKELLLYWYLLQNNGLFE